MKQTLLFITFLLIITTGFSQTVCDTTGNRIYAYLEHPPQPTITEAELELKLSSTISPTSLANYHADYLYVTFIINCKGEDFDYKLAKRSDGLLIQDSTSEFQLAFLSNFQSFATWKPGLNTVMEKGKPVEKPVDFHGSYILKVEGNKLHILNTQEKKKYFKSKKTE